MGIFVNRTYKDETGRIEIAYTCGHSIKRHYRVIKHTKAGTKSFTLHGFNIDDDLAECPYCRVYRLESEEKKEV